MIGFSSTTRLSVNFHAPELARQRTLDSAGCLDDVESGGDRLALQLHVEDALAGLGVFLQFGEMQRHAVFGRRIILADQGQLAASQAAGLRRVEPADAGVFHDQRLFVSAPRRRRRGAAWA